MLITPNNKLSNHYRKKTIRKQVWIEDQSVSGSFYQNLGTMKEKTKIGMFYEDYLNPVFSFSDNFCPDFYSGCSSMLCDDFNGSMMSPYANNGIEGMNSFVGGDISNLGNNNSNFVDGMVFNELTDSQKFGWTVMIDYNGNTGESDPRYVDTDNDGINDNLEDKNKNGKWDESSGETCAYNPDSDGDGLWDGYTIGANIGELTLGTNPLLSDTDGDTLDDGDEVSMGTSPLMKDSDMDGLDDNVEINGYPAKKYDGTSISVTTNPLNPDCDGDGVTDGMEKNGWSVPVMYEGLSEPVIKTLYTDPTNDERKYMDTDGDGMSDMDEINKMSTDSDQYNPFIRENIPPRVESIKTWIEIDKKTIDLKCAGITFFSISVVESIWIKTEVKVYDASGISSLKLELYMKGGAQPYLHTWWEGWTPHAEIRWKTVQTDIGSKTWTNMGSGIHTKTFSCSVDGLTFALSSFIGYFVDVDATDLCGNSVSVEYKKDGFYDIALTYLEQAGNWLYEQTIGRLNEALNQLAEMVSGLRDWVSCALDESAKYFLGRFGGYDFDLDGLSLLLEWYLGTDPFKPTLLLEIDYMDGYAPSKDVNDMDEDGDTDEYIALEYVKQRFADRGVELFYKVDQKTDSKTEVGILDIESNRVAHHWKLYYVYVWYVDEIEKMGDTKPAGYSSMGAGATIARGWIESEYDQPEEWETRIKLETITLLHELGHCMWLYPGGKTVEAHCLHKSNEIYDCVMYGEAKVNIDTRFTNGYCNDCWSRHLLIGKWSTLLTTPEKII